MKQTYVNFILVVCNVIGILFGEIIKVPIKSHVVLTKDIRTNEVKDIYDNKMDTLGSFYNETAKYVEVDFDLEVNYIIEKIVATIKYESSEISFTVGNLINGKGGLAYNCSKKNSNSIYECIPKCRTDDSTRNGIVARKILMSFSVTSKWDAIYELEVYARTKNINSNLVSDNRLVLPDNCNEKSWLLTKPFSSAINRIVHNIGTQIFLEKSYIINEIDVIFQGKIPENLKIQLSNGEKKHDNIVIDISKCTSIKSNFTCQLNKNTFPIRVLTINNEVSQLFLRGKTVFYPTLEVKTSKNMEENLKLTCNINPCDLSVHSDCSENTIKSGVQFTCFNKRLLRMPSGSNSDSYIIVNNGQVEKFWSNTKFNVESNYGEGMIVSMPRSYQYFGNYQCSCIVNDESNTDITSKITFLTEADFLENLVFKIDLSYKLEENEKNYKKVLDNLIILRQSSLKNSYIIANLASYSLVNEIVYNVAYPNGPSDVDTQSLFECNSEIIKAFDENPDSWSVNIYKYSFNEFFPEFYSQGIKINYVSKKYNLTQNSSIQFIKINETQITKPEFIQVITNKLISIKVVYTGEKTIKLTVTEETCSKTNIQELAQIHKNKCSISNAQTVCSYPDNVALISFKKDRNFATKYNFSVVEASSNVTLQSIIVNSTLIFDIKDIVIKTKYIDINADLLKPEITKVDVEIKFLSKIIDDFIPCGKVTLKIMEPQKTIREMVLQVSKITLSVDLISTSVNITLTVKIDGIEGAYITVLTVTDPTTFSVENVKIQFKPKLSLIWNGINKIAHDLLVKYEVGTATTIIACNSTQHKVLTIEKFDNPDNQGKYQTELESLSEKYSSKLVVYVQPIFKNDKRGKRLYDEKLSDSIRSTKITIDNKILPRQRTITLIPSQSDIPCTIGKVNFTIQSSNVVNPIKDITEIGKMRYKIDKLIPGRKYELRAQVNYKFGPADSISEVYTFETADDISISQALHRAQVHDNVNITCIADVGPIDTFRKTVEWRRADNSPLPERVQSVTNPNNPGSAVLKMTNALADYSGDYGCYAIPPASVGRAKITVIINDLVLNPNGGLIVDFSKSLEPISITCSSSTIGDGKLSWSYSDNLIVSENKNDNFKIEQIVTTEKTIKSILTIRQPSLNTSGTYTCLKSIGEINVSQTFTLYGEEKLNVSVKESSEFVGGITKLSCSGQLATKNQKVMWDTKSIEDKDEIVKVNYRNSSDYSIQDIEIINNVRLHQVSCRIVPSYGLNRKQTSVNYSIKLTPKIEAYGPTNVTAGSSANFTCIGYPTNSASILQWVFYNETSMKTTRKGVIVSSTKNQPNAKSYEPIKLIMILKNVENNKTGQYQCKFKTKSNAEYLTSKSISLAVDTNKYTIVEAQCSNCLNKSARTVFNFYSSRSIFLSVFIVFALLINPILY